MFSPASGDLLHFPPLPDHRRWRPSAAAEHAPSCPRCASPNTKFCYYNNYSLSQPRYFCKGCKRYWTKGGSLRNVPVGGGCRKNRRRRAPSHNNNNPNAPTTTTIGQPGGSGLDSDFGSGIDLAVVYANFLNPTAAAASSGSEQDDGTRSEFPDEGNNANGVEIYDSSSVMYPVDRDQEPEFLLPGDPGRVGLESQVELGLVSMGSFHDYSNQIQSLLEDGLVQDALWSSPDQTRPDPDLATWQSVMQLQDLDLLQPGSDGGDCLKIDSGFNPAVDNWSSFNFQCI